MHGKINLLLIEDNPGDARLIEEMLKEAKYLRIDFYWRESLRAGIEAVGKTAPDVILLDPGLADSRGLDGLKRIRRVSPRLPIVILTGLEDEEMGVRALKEGAQDYTVKGDIGPENLERVVRYAIERKQHENRLELANQILKQLSRRTGIQKTISRILDLIQEFLGVDAVGIRLKERDDYPYFESRGFSREFIRVESYLCERDGTGSPVRDADSNPVLECMCGRILRGRTAGAALPFFTGCGSFWTNSTTLLLDPRTEATLGVRLRNRCNAEGYESLALIPLQDDRRIIGLLQIAQKQQNMFSLDLIEFFEGIGSSIGIALERIRSEDAIENSEARFRSLMDNNADAIIVIDAAGVIRYVNNSASVFWERTKAELIGREFGFPIVADESSEIEVVGKSGRKRIGEVRVVEIDWQGETVFLGTIRDITDFKNSEKEKAELESHLQQAQKMESIGTLAGGIAHDFNNILSAIIGYSELALARDPSDKDIDDDLNEILHAGRRARQLVDQILTFSRRPERGLAPIAMYVIVNEALKMLRSTLPTTIEIKTELNTRGDVLADPTRIHQLVVNLCTNAYHAMKPNTGTLSVSLSEETLRDGDPELIPEMPPGPYIRLAVGDTGIGMDDKTLARIFEPYYTTKPKGEGTGLGLAVVHGVVQSHHGFMKVESAPGRGSVFHVFFPKLKRMADQPSREPEAPLPRGTERVLLVDDERNVVKTVRRTLEQLGYHVESTLSSTDALAIFAREPDKFDLVITDMTMPGMTGYELARKLLMLRPDIPIILCTGFSDVVTEKKAIEVGIRGFLMKPVLRRDLAESVRGVLDRPGARGPGGTSSARSPGGAPDNGEDGGAWGKQD